MRRLLCFALFLLFCTSQSWAILAQGILCPNSGPLNQPIVQVNYGQFIIQDVSVQGQGVTSSFTCQTTPGPDSSVYVSYDISAPNGFSIVFGNAASQSEVPYFFSNVSPTVDNPINGGDFYTTTFTAAGNGQTLDNLFIGLAVQGGKTNATWSASTHSSELIFDPPSSHIFVELSIDPKFPTKFPGVPEPSTLLLLVSGLGTLAVHRHWAK